MGGVPMRTMTSSTIVLLLAGMLHTCHAGGKPVPTPSPVVTVSSGKLQGLVEGPIQVFRGIPFAAPPIEDLRWRPPVLHPNWDGVRPAQAYGAHCIQSSGEGTEDCLFLNVYAPLAAPSKPLPVMVFVHGGSYKDGSGDVNCTAMVEFANRSAIVVTTNYRLNVFGFAGGTPLRLRDSRPDGSGGTMASTGNYGIQDQRAAFTWVRDNIHAFGGDGSRVTIFGESAGAGSMTNHLSQPASWGLFQGVILESGSFSQWTSNTLITAADTWGQIVTLAGCAEPEGSLMASPVDCMVNLNASTVSAAMLAQQDTLGAGYLRWAPVVDGVELMDHPWKLVEDGKVAPDVPILHGTNRDEGSMFIGETDYQLTVEDAKRYMTAQYGPITGETILEAYTSNYSLACPDPTKYSTAYCGVVRSFGDYLFSCPARHATKALSASRSVWLYYFTPNATKYNMPLDEHASELAFVFQQDDGYPTAGKELADTMTSYWVNFANHLDPNGPSFAPASSAGALPQWLADDGSGGLAMSLDFIDASGVQMIHNLKERECEDTLIPWTDSRIKGRYWRPKSPSSVK